MPKGEKPAGDSGNTGAKRKDSQAAIAPIKIVSIDALQMGCCETCHKPIEGRGKRFCCHECYWKWKCGRVGLDASRSMYDDEICTQCGRKFRWHGTILRRKVVINKFCSKSCHDEWQGEHPYRKKTGEVICEWCGDSKPVSPTANKRFCSFQCYWQWKSVYMWKGGCQSNQGVGWNRLTRIIREKFSHRCSNCGIEENGRRHAAHHIKPFGEFLKISRGDTEIARNLAHVEGNLTLLCARCHWYAHHSKGGDIYGSAGGVFCTN